MTKEGRGTANSANDAAKFTVGQALTGTSTSPNFSSRLGNRLSALDNMLGFLPLVVQNWPGLNFLLSEPKGARS